MRLEVKLTGPRGDNPLGFLAALGALVVLEDAGCDALLYWDNFTPHVSVDCPEIEATKPSKAILDILVDELEKGNTGTGKNERFDLLKDIEEKNLDLKNSKLYELFEKACSERNGSHWSRQLELISFCGIIGPNDKMLASKWNLLSGAGHQNFLEAVRNIIKVTKREHLQKAIFGPWEEKDVIDKSVKNSLNIEGTVSLRLDPDEDRRYALMHEDPSSQDVRTLIGANRLAFEALRIFTSFPVRGGKLGTVAWKNDELRWPLWRYPARSTLVRSLLYHPEIWSVHETDSSKEQLRLMGVTSVLQSRKFRVSKYVNISPGTPIWMG